MTTYTIPEEIYQFIETLPESVNEDYEDYRTILGDAEDD